MLTRYDLADLIGQYPATLQEPKFHRYILREYLELSILEHLMSSSVAEKLTFIGGTCLRITRHIDRWSEDLGFDCKKFSAEEFNAMSKGVERFLKKQGYPVEMLDHDDNGPKAYRCVLNFPGLLQELGLSGHPDERFKLEIEAQDQGVNYRCEMRDVSRENFHFILRTAPDDILLSMKLSAILGRAKGRDFYDALFLLQKTEPDFHFLNRKCGIANWNALKYRLEEKIKTVDLEKKKTDFRHLLFKEQNADRISRFRSIVGSHPLKMIPKL